MAKAKNPKRTPTLTDQLQAAIAATGLTVYRIAKDAGIQEATLHRFMAGERDIRLSTADQLAAFLGLRLVGRPTDG